MDGDYALRSSEQSSVGNASLLSTAQAVTLLRALSSDASIHERFQKAPAEILAELGLPEAFVACCKDIRLPPREVIRATEQSLVSDLTCKGTQQVIGLHAA